MAKLALGTVQFGLDYGISNTVGKVPLKEVEAILSYAAANGIDILDTAQGYGESEKVLSQLDLRKFKVVTKIIGPGKLEDSLKTLNLSSVYALMFHREDEVNAQSWALFESYKKQNMTSKIGVSVYSPAKLEKLINTYPVDIVQFPLNILDERFLQILPQLKQKGIEVHTRSTFLQGLLLMPIDKINKYFEEIKPLLATIPEPKLAQALGFVKAQDGVDSIVVGVTSLTDLKQIVEAYNINTPKIDYSKFMTVAERFINPSKWELCK